MINSKGGFLVEEGKKVDEKELEKLRQRERQRLMQNAEPRQSMHTALILLHQLTHPFFHRR
jgi:hypothetical protein